MATLNKDEIEQYKLKEYFEYTCDKVSCTKKATYGLSTVQFFNFADKHSHMCYVCDNHKFELMEAK